MAQTPVTVTYPLEEVLGQINQKLDDIRHDVTDIKIEQAVIKGDINAIKGEISNLKEGITEIKGSQKAQIWTLIGVLGTAVVGTVIRFVITALPGNP